MIGVVQQKYYLKWCNKNF